MLVLSRQRDETIYVDTPEGIRIEITVMDIRGDKVRLGITAPIDHEINRKEVADAKAAAPQPERSAS